MSHRSNIGRAAHDDPRSGSPTSTNPVRAPMSAVELGSLVPLDEDMRILVLKVSDDLALLDEDRKILILKVSE